MWILECRWCWEAEATSGLSSLAVLDPKHRDILQVGSPVAAALAVAVAVAVVISRLC